MTVRRMLSLMLTDVTEDLAASIFMALLNLLVWLAIYESTLSKNKPSYSLGSQIHSYEDYYLLGCTAM